ncbi:hypothetical protein Cch01nite_41640 [Cellulomonas chitinilytica]|uniref:YgjV family protein n=1 Tax=Cellulomonas chitinilytica TaxID=398759 RepID=A0A919P648_9CELL|nr:hypothetical protein [Cellulomonas chitinilytica]GIG23440.1 hypothetical protein Cch01nite_41640 [Cellulomonas chitinilytica]
MLELIGWAGSLLVIVSLMQARVLRFRVLNLVGAFLATVYNTAIGVWPFAAMNAVISVIDIYWLWRLTRERHDDQVYAVVEVAPDDAYLQHILKVHRDDIAQFQPGFALDAPAAEPSAPEVAGSADGRASFLVVRGDETVGVVVVRGVGDGVGRVELDWVSPRFRDFTPGEFVYRRSGVFAAHGFRSLVVEPAPKSTEYLQKVGFRPRDGVWERQVEDVAA